MMTAQPLSTDHISAAIQRIYHIEPKQGNAVEVLQNGAQTFPAMLHAIARAQQSITFENYRFWSDETGWKFARALAERARAGVMVHIVYDSYGSASASDEFWAYLRDAGVAVRAFHGLLEPEHSALIRDHRKLMVVDGRIGFIGGHCISNHWSHHGIEHEQWRDMHCQVEGPAVADLQAVFDESWREAGGEPLDRTDPRYFPKLSPSGPYEVMMLASSTKRKLSHVYRTAFDHARARIWIANAYFVPDDETKEALKAATRRGVEVRLLVPARGDMWVVVPAARSMYEEFLEAGCAIYEYQPTVMHAKIALIDGCWATIGSCNLDHWSLDVNYEANVGISGTDLVRDMEATYQRDLEQSQQIKLHEWRKRPVTQRLKQQVIGMFKDKL